MVSPITSSWRAKAMERAEWTRQVYAFVADRMEAKFDFNRVNDVVWRTGYESGLSPEHMGLVLMVADAVAGIRINAAGQPEVKTAEPAKVVKSALHAKGSALLGK